MKKSKILNLLLILLLPVVSILFPIFSSFSQEAHASIEGLSANQYILTGKVGSSVKHYFTNEKNESTLIGAKASEEGGTHYSIVPNTLGSLDKMSSGYAEVIFPKNIIDMINAGVVYAYATFDFKAKNNNPQSNIRVNFNVGNHSQVIETNGKSGENKSYSTEHFKLELGTSGMNFSFETLEKTSVGNYSDFVLSMPTLRLYTVVDSITFENTSSYVSANQTVKLSGFNSVTKVVSEGNFWAYCQVRHKINYNIVEGAEYATLVNDNLFINNDAPFGAEIKVQASCRKKSDEEEMLTSDIATYIVNSEKVMVNISTDFQNPAEISGMGEFNVGEKTVLSVIPYDDFTFKGWFINGELKSLKSNYIYTATQGDVIYAKFIRSISIESVSATKTYDGTRAVDSYSVTFSGKEDNHDLYINGIDFEFSSQNAGEMTLAYDDAKLQDISLEGNDKEIYELSSQLIKSTYGKINPKSANIYAKDATAQYGNAYILTYDASGLVDGESLSGELGVDGGTNVGVHKINLGTLAERNPNYTFTMANEAYLTISQREIVINLSAKDKVYDKTTDAEVYATVSNVVNNEQVEVVVSGAKFSDANAGFDIPVVVTEENLTLQGEHASNYIIKSFDSSNLYANINKKSIQVIAENKTFQYGQEIELSYSVVGMFEGDVLEGELTIDNGNVGQHIIENNLISNNYEIDFTSAICEIVPKSIIIIAQPASKVYGDSDPVFDYQVSEETPLLNNDTLSGQLSREEGENVGHYQITLGTLGNGNYSLQLLPATFEITKRKVTFVVTFEDKEYDGTNGVTFSAVQENALEDNQFTLNIEAILNSVNVGIADVTYNDISVSGENLNNHEFDYIFENQQINISRRNVEIIIDKISKIYGETDPENIAWTVSNIVEGDSLIGEPKRNEGEDVGFYTYYLDTLNNENNPNYNIVLKAQNFEIKKREILLTSDSLSKIFGEADPDFVPKLAENQTLAFDHTFEDVISGLLSRQTGEEAGSYKLIIGDNLVCNPNYQPVMEEVNFIVNRREVKVICDEATKIYGDEDPVFTFQTENEVEGFPVSISIRREYGEDVGNYQLMAGSLNDPRYIITFVPSILKITPSDITVTAESKIKIYGDEDPYFNVIVTDGLLKNNDQLSFIMEGKLQRQEGENVGKYQINVGTLSLGKNYNMTYLPEYLEIFAREIEVSALAVQKIYGASEVELGYQVTKGEILAGDGFTGTLERVSGEDVGHYDIQLGTLSLGANYQITFVPNTYEIVKRKLEVIPTVKGKIYGEEEPELTYTIIGTIIEGDELSGELTREKPVSADNPLLYENVGRYKFVCTLENENYEIIFGDHSFTIEAREIKIIANEVSKIYGEEDPELSYSIISGEILAGDQITGEIYRVPGEDAGEYDIRSSLTLGRNYKIDFKKSTFVIKPIELKIQTKQKSYSKVYGEFDPAFEYEIVSGAVLEGDELYGSISREAGEEAGRSYLLISNISNINYNISFVEDVRLTILRKDVVLIVGVYDKIEDGNNKATIKTPVLSGLISKDEDVYLEYDISNCATFEKAEVGRWKVNFVKENIKLAGSNAHNYNLILPDNVYGNITYKELLKGEISIASIDNANLYSGSEVDYETFSIDRGKMGLGIRKVVLGYNIWLENNDQEEIKLSTSIKLTIKVSDDIASLKNIYVYQKNEDGKYVLISSKRNEKGQVVIVTDKLGEFVIMTDNDSWIEIGAFACAILLVLLIIIVLIVFFAKRNAEKKRRKAIKNEEQQIINKHNSEDDFGEDSEIEESQTAENNSVEDAENDQNQSDDAN